jgi:tetrahydromethanopterin S-methyltransferase subunit E
MRKVQFLFFGFAAMFVLGCSSCVPGICGCALSIWPVSWEGMVSGPAVISDLVGFIGMLVCAILLLVLWTRRRTIEHTARRREDHLG